MDELSTEILSQQKELKNSLNKINSEFINLRQIHNLNYDNNEETINSFLQLIEKQNGLLNV
jgi:hypothetical protein